MNLEISNLNSYYDKSHVLHDVSLEIRNGTVVALLGRNGAGKSTLIRSIMGVEEVRTEGTIQYGDTDLDGMFPEERADLGIGWVPERRRIFPNLTVKENLSLGALRGSGQSMTFDNMFELFPRLEERTEQLGGTLSGGEQQMLAIARALLTEPDLILIDEPFEGLMPSLVRDVGDVLKDLSDEEYSILLVEQKPKETLEIADEAYVIDIGNLVFSGTSDELLRDDHILEKHIGMSEL